MKKVKNVIKGYRSRFDLEELTIISNEQEKVYFSGSLLQWDGVVDIYLLNQKKEIENSQVLKEINFNNRKLFIFIQ